jgi:hypothetical protein
VRVPGFVQVVRRAKLFSLRSIYQSLYFVPSRAVPSDFV